MTDGATIQASGGVLWRRSDAGVEIAIVHRPKYDDWSMPKGKLHAGEVSLLAACREVVEETGVRPVVGRRLPTQEYRLGPDRKVVDYWEMTPAPGPAVTALGRAAEVDVVRWLRPSEAATWLSYDRDRELLRTFISLPPTDTVILLLRHGQAGDRSGWSGDDRLRPLDAEGRAQAQALRALAWFGPRRVFSADRVRCVQTVAPLADDLGVPVETEPALAEDAYLANPGRGLRRIREMARSRLRAVVCSQGDVIPDLVYRMAAEDGLALGKLHARKASVWALSLMDGRLVAAQYYPDLGSAGRKGPAPSDTGPGGAG
jgi:phosphohistidine phosphatase SixA/ADP-ribose pyrophosphatase YjhB (NUDIX family)